MEAQRGKDSFGERLCPPRLWGPNTDVLTTELSDGLRSLAEVLGRHMRAFREQGD